MGYLEKVQGMWHAPVKHYEPIEGMPPDDDDENDPHGTTTEDIERYSHRFQDHFALPATETLVATYFGNFFRVLPLYGKIYISKNYFCFRSLFPGMRTKLVLPLDRIESALKDSGLRKSYGYYGMVLTIQGHEEIFFEFASMHARDDCTVTLALCIEGLRDKVDHGELGALGEPSPGESVLANEAMAEYQSLRSLANNQNKSQNPQTQEQYQEANKNLTSFVRSAGPDAPTLLYDDPASSTMLNFKPAKPMRITCLTIGSRGDVQPYIALAKGLMADGHIVKIATHEEFGSWIEGHGIEFAPISGDPGELMKLCIEYGTFTLQFLREASSKVC
jgi:sterol 3beta-glucosyltransferase